MSPKVGRNDPCPCGSGRKFKKCHLVATPPPAAVWQAADRYFAEHQRQEVERKSQFGEIRAPVSAQSGEQRFVAVGNQVYWGKWRLFTDFLDPFFCTVFNREWGEEHIAKPEAERHTLVDWRMKAWNFLKGVPVNEHQIRSAIPNGFVSAFFSFVYDLFVVADNNRLDDALLARLMHPEQFQGARHELFAEATCLRAGFSITHEDHTLPGRHVEFVATYKSTGQKISVEAKSRHRPGVLGRKGQREAPERVNTRFGSLLRDASTKAPLHPLVIFLDTNLPVANANRFFLPQSPGSFRPPPATVRLLDLVRKQNGGPDPYELLVFTNHPHHYAEESEADPARHLLGALARIPSPPDDHLTYLTAICRAATLYGNIPTEFPATR